ncbi:phage tail sheath subtilisin-like domain-containing protein [Trinickia sp. YCB016]
MAANYLHGVETIEVERGPRPVRTVKSAVIALIGTAPMGPVNEPTLVLSEKDAAAFGPQAAGFTIPQALSAIYAHGAGTVIVVNVLDPAKHTHTKGIQGVYFSDRAETFKLDLRWLTNVTVQDNARTKTFVQGVDYTVDASTGEVRRIKTGSIGTAAVYVTYTGLDPSKVTAADIIGAVNAAGVRTGLKALKDTYNRFGFFAKILLAPAYCTQSAVTAEMISVADQLDAIAYVDAPIGTTFAQVLEGRGPNSTINFNTSSDRARLCYPHVKVYDSALDAERLEPLSSRAAGLRAKVDLDNGFWWSSSNQELAGVIGVERQLSAMIDDPQSEVNLLNEAGITTVFSSFGSGFRLWGNRTAAWPTVSHMRNFENVRRTGDVINESIRYFSQQYIDMPLNQATIDSLVESVNGYGRKLIGDGALLGFKAWFDPARNPETEMANGHLLISYKYTVPPPLERLTFETEITSEYLLTLKGGN